MGSVEILKYIVKKVEYVCGNERTMRLWDIRLTKYDYKC